MAAVLQLGRIQLVFFGGPVGCQKEKTSQNCHQTRSEKMVIMFPDSTKDLAPLKINTAI